MLSLIYNLFQYTLKYIYLDKTKIEDIDKVISRIEYTDDIDETVRKKETLDKIGCYYKTGIVTRVTTDYVLIDNSYTYEKDNELSSNLKVGDNVYYLAFLRDNDAKPKIRKIISVMNDEWSNAKSKENITHTNMIQRSIIGKVTKREGRICIVEPNNIRIDLSKVQSEFIPLVGDWLTLESLVEINCDSTDLSGEILEVDKIKPLRSKLDVGVISKYDLGTQVGVIDKNIIFHKDACEPGYIPCINDKIVSESIESDQGIYSWRSITVVSLNRVPDKTQLSFTDNFHSIILNETSDLLKNKYGITIDDKLEFNLDIEEENILAVLIHNTGSYAHMLRSSSFVSQKTPSQLSVISPININNNIVINPSENVTYIFKCKAKFVGRSEELFIFDFKDFKIGRLFHIIVNAKNASQNVPETITVQKSSQKNNFINLDELNNTNYNIPGIRPIKPPAFIKVRTGIFKVPKYIWNAVSNIMQNNKSLIQCEIDLGNEIPSLLQPFNFETYKERFHILLYLEQIAQTLCLQQYNIESVIMRRCGEYLVLKVLGLAEKRPSLLVGDKAIVSFKWDSSQGKLKYEGFIHKVTSTEIFLKFNEKFHQDYNSEDCQVQFKYSQSSIQRSHNAVNLAINRLGPDFLFPTRVVEKEPQFDLEEYEIEEKPIHSRINKKLNESMSSICSSNSVVSDASFENTVRMSPKISVVERLFNVKPAELSPEETKVLSMELKKSQGLKTGLTIGDDSNKINIADTSVPSKMSDMSKPTVEIDDELKPYIAQIKRRKLNWFNENLNYYQKEAVRNILMGLARPLPYVIFGPPGTGKTITLCEAILQILTVVPESRLLVASPSNSSANLIAERLLKSNVLKPGDLVRLISYHCLYDDSIPEQLLPYCATAELGDKLEENFNRHENGLRLNCTMAVLGRHRVTIGTCHALGILYNMGFPRGHFSHVLVDEAGQATEPEIMIPLNFIHSDHGQVVLAGDPLQLGPVVQSNLALHYGFGESFLSRLLYQFPYQKDVEGFETGYDPRLVTKLLFNYRSLPEILNLPNSLFYDSELQPQISPKKSKEAKLLKMLKEELPERNGSPPALVFHGVSGANYRDSDSPSWYNPAEATQVYLYLLKLYKCGLEPDDIGIITPYQKQVKRIKDLLLELDLKLPKISSVEGFQGQERKVIILSTVRSCDNLVEDDIKYALGFIASPKRFNVAITRARALLIILGNPKLLAFDPYWRSVLKYCIDHSAYTGCNFLPSYITDLQV